MNRAPPSQIRGPAAPNDNNRRQLATNNSFIMDNVFAIVHSDGSIELRTKDTNQENQTYTQLPPSQPPTNRSTTGARALSPQPNRNSESSRNSEPNRGVAPNEQITNRSNLNSSGPPKLRSSGPPVNNNRGNPRQNGGPSNPPSNSAYNGGPSNPPSNSSYNGGASNSPSSQPFYNRGANPSSRQPTVSNPSNSPSNPRIPPSDRQQSINSDRQQSINSDRQPSVNSNFTPNNGRTSSSTSAAANNRQYGQAKEDAGNMSGSLPFGWEEVTTDDGYTYFWDTETGITSWKKPKPSQY